LGSTTTIFCKQDKKRSSPHIKFKRKFIKKSDGYLETLTVPSLFNEFAVFDQLDEFFEKGAILIFSFAYEKVGLIATYNRTSYNREEYFRTLQPWTSDRFFPEGHWRIFLEVAIRFFQEGQKR